jgi:hypothetical protein
MESEISRPEITESLILEVAKKLNQGIYFNNQCPEHIAKHYDLGRDDGFSLIDKLKTHEEWEVSTDLIIELQKLFWMTLKYHRALEENWFEENNIQPPYPVGTRTKQGTITAISEKVPAKYVMDNNKYRLCKFEHVELFDEDATNDLAVI